jgi:hypothetical protein
VVVPPLPGAPRCSLLVRGRPKRQRALQMATARGWPASAAPTFCGVWAIHRDREIVSEKQRRWCGLANQEGATLAINLTH